MSTVEDRTRLRRRGEPPVTVVGAGPAGLACAIMAALWSVLEALARQGRRGSSRLTQGSPRRDFAAIRLASPIGHAAHRIAKIRAVNERA